MAEKVLFNVAGGILGSLAGPLIAEEFRMVRRVKREIEKLQNTVSAIQAVLLHAEELRATNPLVDHWLGRLDDVIYEADDLLDAVSTKVLRRKEKKAGKVFPFDISSGTSGDASVLGSDIHSKLSWDPQYSKATRVFPPTLQALPLPTLQQRNFVIRRRNTERTAGLNSDPMSTTTNYSSMMIQRLWAYNQHSSFQCLLIPFPLVEDVGFPLATTLPSSNSNTNNVYPVNRSPSLAKTRQ